MNEDEIQITEIDLLLESLVKRYGYDFRSYARASLERRLHQFIQKKSFQHISELIPVLMRNENLFKELVYNISVPVSEFFRNPNFFKVIREEVIPVLKTYPYVKIWNAGCANGQEVYSMAIILQEEGVYDKTQIYATDFNDVALEKAREGIYPVELIKRQNKHYVEAGGIQAFSDHYYAKYDHIIFDQNLKKNIIFANHNLISDSAFGEMNLILCRNVFIYFNQELQDQILGLFLDSLLYGGFLCLGSNESIRFSSQNQKLSFYDERNRIFKKEC